MTVGLRGREEKEREEKGKREGRRGNTVECGGCIRAAVDIC